LSSSDSQRSILEAIGREYGEDRTFAVPILMNCALAGFVDWSDIPGLPFDLAVLPPTFYKILRLHVVSYAMPALIAIGLLLDRRNSPKNPLKRWIRKATASKVLRILQSMQPAGGGFLEAVPLTSFAAMGLVSTFGAEQPVAAECLKFLRQSQRADGSWPIDSNLSTWLTTSAVAALAEARQLEKIDRRRIARWIAERQYTSRHPFTHAAPGGWPWTHLPGGVPDADDTSGAILALAELNSVSGEAASKSKRLTDGATWLLDLQNSDGGWPTFCRGWGKLPFDRSSPDITAHVLRALRKIESWERKRIESAIRRGLDYLARTQRPDGSWIPLWFGNQSAPGRENPAIGTSLVLRALEEFDSEKDRSLRGVEYLLGAQNSDGGWGGAAAVPSTLEETALAISALAPWEKSADAGKAIHNGVEYLLREMESSLERPSPIGLYFSHLWYAEKLYPQIWTLEALGRAVYHT
jgi:squalene-hopene/tetraprenyl-beta-curcumene cyclase